MSLDTLQSQSELSALDATFKDLGARVSSLAEVLGAALNEFSPELLEGVIWKSIERPFLELSNKANSLQDQVLSGDKSEKIAQGEFDDYVSTYRELSKKLLRKSIVSAEMAIPAGQFHIIAVKYRILWDNAVKSLKNEFLSNTGILIKKENTQPLPVEIHDAIVRIDKFARENPGNSIVDFASSALKDTGYFSSADIGTNDPSEGGLVKSTEPLLSVAPEIWQGGRGSSETPPQFIMRVYGQWMGKGLGIADVRRLDPTLAKAFYNHKRLHPDAPLPEGFDLPTKEELNSRQLEALRAKAPHGKLGEVIGEFTLREAGRLRSAQQRRNK